MFPTNERDERDAPTVPTGMVLASIARRAGGALIDELLVFIPSAVGAAVAGYRIGDDISDDAVLLFNVALAVTALIYETLLIGFFGRTVGKIAMGTRVVRQRDGGRVGWFAALQRSMVPVVATGVPELGWLLGPIVYAVAFFSPLRQGVHDKAAGTVVVMDRIAPA